MECKISILFYTRIASTTRNNLVPVYLRITVNGKRFEQAINRTIQLSKWSNKAGRMKGTHAEARIFNNYLDIIRNKVHIAEREMLQDGKIISFQSFKEKWLGVSEKQHMLLEVFHQHNTQLKELVGKEYSPGTLQRYETSKLHTKSYLNWKFKANDINIKELDYEFINDYAFWLKSKRNCSHNTSMKYLANFKKIVLLCLKNGWLQKDPFIGFKLTKKEVERSYLTEHELHEILSRQFSTFRLELVRDIFIFSCYTGLAYSDVKKLSRLEIAIGVDGEKWIFTKRQKTDTASRIPLLPISLQILDKYKNHSQCEHGKLLPVLSNQKMNAYLKEIADLCTITKNLSFHTARHTFATTVTLSNGVPIETVSKMLGHKSLRTTQHYAKILDNKVSNDMKILKEKLGAKRLML